ncbi:MAG: 5'-3' exonuclease H3TH domain-containing protein [Candidatus Nealsonbacteria bacterium]
MTKEKKYLIVIDSNSIIHRAFHALPPLKKKNGEIVNAVYGFLLVFIKAIQDFKPSYIVATFDLPKPTFRHKKYKEYKGKREKSPEELYSQIPKIKEFLKLFKVPIVEKEGFEADDIIGTVSRIVPKKDPKIETIILSGDLDVLQLVNNKTKVFTLRKGVKDIILYDDKLVKERFGGLGPEQLIDYKGLRGDPSDNIPGVVGIGEKTAINLLLEFKTLENIYKNIAKTKNISERIKKSLLDNKKMAFLSKELAEINVKTPIDIKIEDCEWGVYDKNKVMEMLDEYEFFNIKKRFIEMIREENKLIGENLKLW